MTVLEGHAWEDVRSEVLDSELILLVEQDPLLQAVLEFTALHPVQTTMMAKLQKELTALAKSNGLLGIGKGRWPGASWTLSNRLSSLSPVLQRLGVGVSIRRTNAGSEVTLKLLAPASNGDAASVTASRDASLSNRLPDNDFGKSDAPSKENADSALIEKLKHK